MRKERKGQITGEREERGGGERVGKRLRAREKRRGWKESERLERLR